MVLIKFFTQTPNPNFFDGPKPKIVLAIFRQSSGELSWASDDGHEEAAALLVVTRQLRAKEFPALVKKLRPTDPRIDAVKACPICLGDLRGDPDPTAASRVCGVCRRLEYE
jgi:hypothetical protein